MAITNHERVGKAMELLRTGLGPFVEREIATAHPTTNPAREALRYWGDHNLASRPIPEWDVHALLRLMWDSWNAVFRNTLGHAERTYVSELRTARNNWAHQRRFSTDDAYRALDSTHRMLTSVSAPEAAEAEKMKMELLRLRFDEQARHVRRKGARTALKIGVTSSLPGWRMSWRRIRTWQAGGTTKPNSLPICGRSTRVKDRTSTATPPSSSGAPT